MPDTEKNYKKGSAVVEMAYIMPLFLGMIVLIMNTVFYCHDKAVITGAAAETAILAAQTERRESAEYDMEEFFYDRIGRKLIYLTDVNIRIEQDDDEICVRASAQKGAMKLDIIQKSLIADPEERIRLLR